jgi:hypothetical protein
MTFYFVGRYILHVLERATIFTERHGQTSTNTTT